MAVFSRLFSRPLPPTNAPDAPARKRSLPWRILKAGLPLVLIAVGIYVVYNFPALKSHLEYWLHKPKPGNTALLPPTIFGNSQIPIQSGAACGKPIPYDDQGNPKAICDNYIYIPKIRVAAPIVWPNSPDDGVVNEALLRGVIHYPGTADPGQRGNVFLTGHSSYYWWVQTDYNNVFTLVPELAPNDEIVVYNRGIRYIYRVSDTFEVAPDDTSVLQPTETPVVTLSTCVPIGTSYRRKIVRANQVSPDPSTAQTSQATGVTTGRLPGIR